MKIRQIGLVAAAMLAAVTLYAQIPLVRTPPDQLTPAQLQLKAKADNAPDIPNEVVPNFFKMPPNMYMGEAIGLAENSKGHVFIQTCTERTRVFEFDPQGNYVREIGKDLFGNVYCHGLRIDHEDNIWVVDEGSNTIIKFNPEGRVTMVLGRRPDYPVSGLTPAVKAQDPAPKYLFNRQTDVAIDLAGNIFVSDGYVNARVVSTTSTAATSRRSAIADRSPESSTCRMTWLLTSRETSMWAAAATSASWCLTTT